MQNKVFLKEESLLISKINDLYKARDYEKIATFRNEIFDNIEIYKKTKIIFQVISALFMSKHFSECVTCVEELLKREVEDMRYSFFLLASLIALNDIDMAKSYLKRSKLMSSNYVESIILEDGANYSNILSAKNLDDIPCLLLINYIKEFDKEGNDTDKGFRKEDIRIYKYFELVDDIYACSYDSEVIEYMLSIGRIMFEN